MLTAACVPQFSLFNHWPVVFFKSCLSNSSSIFFYMHMGMRQSLPVNWKIMRNSSQRSFLQKLSGRCSGVLPSPIPPRILQYYNRQCHDVIRGPTPVQTPIPQTENPGSWNCATNDWLVLLCGLSSPLPRSQLQWITWATAGDGCEMGGGNYVLAVASSCLSSPWAYCHQRLRTRDPGSVLSCAMYDCGSMVELGRCFYDLADRSILSYLASGVSYGCCWRSSRH